MSDPTAPLSFRADEIDRAALDQLAAVLDLQAARPGIRRLREWSLADLHLQPG